MRQEAPKGVIVLGFDPAAAVITQEASAADSGLMRVRVPFYVSNSVAQAPGFSVPLFFPKDALPGIVQEAQAQIGRGDMIPLTVYCRHADALDPKEVPIGRVDKVLQDGPTGYAEILISSAGKGGVMQQLIRDGMVNAVSLRSRGDWEMERVKVNGELMLEVKRLPLAGIDFAPEGPAQPTFGIEILQEAPRVEPEDVEPPAEVPADTPTPSQEDSEHMEITLEAVREKADLVLAIEKPLRDELETVKGQLATVTQERDEAKAQVVTLEAEKAASAAQAAIDGFVAETVAKLPEKARQEARTIVLEAVKEAKTLGDAQVAVAPVLLDLSLRLAQFTPAPTPAPPAPEAMRSASDMLFDLVVPARASAPVLQESGETPAAGDKPARETVMGLEIPD